MARRATIGTAYENSLVVGGRSRFRWHHVAVVTAFDSTVRRMIKKPPLKPTLWNQGIQRTGQRASDALSRQILFEVALSAANENGVDPSLRSPVTRLRSLFGGKQLCVLFALCNMGQRKIAQLLSSESDLMASRTVFVELNWGIIASLFPGRRALATRFVDLLGLMAVTAVQLHQRPVGGVGSEFLRPIAGSHLRRQHPDFKSAPTALFYLARTKVLGMIKFDASTILQQRSELQR